MQWWCGGRWIWYGSGAVLDEVDSVERYEVTNTSFRDAMEAASALPDVPEEALPFYFDDAPPVPQLLVWLNRFGPLDEDLEPSQWNLADLGRLYVTLRRFGRYWRGCKSARRQERESLLGQVLVDLERELARGTAGIRLGFQASFEGVRTTAVPFTLRGELWLRVLNAIGSEPAERRCEHCGTAFSVGNNRGRKPRFCQEHRNSASYKRTARRKARLPIEAMVDED